MVSSSPTSMWFGRRSSLASAIFFQSMPLPYFSSAIFHSESPLVTTYFAAAVAAAGADGVVVDGAAGAAGAAVDGAGVAGAGVAGAGVAGAGVAGAGAGAAGA